MFTALTFGQTFEVMDRNGVPVITVSDVKMFRYSDYFKTDIPDFQSTVKNVSGGMLLRVSITGIVHKKDGSVVKFNLDNACGKQVAPCTFQKDYIHDATYAFGQPSKFDPSDFGSVEFTLERAERPITKDGFHFSGFIAKDEGCFTDYLTATSLTGVAFRKSLAELLQYDCGFIVEKPQTAVTIGKTKTFKLGAKQVIGTQILLSDEGIQFGLDPPANSFDLGWALLSALKPGPVLTTEKIGATQEK